MKSGAFIAVLLAATVVLAAESNESGVRTWTSADGQTVQAAFVKLEYGTVHLATPEGKDIGIRLEKLSAEDQKLAEKLAAAPPKLSSPGLKRPDETLTDQEIEGLQTQWTNETGARKIRFDASFGPKRLSDSEKKKYQKSGEIPIRIIATLSEQKADQKPERLAGTCRFYILDPEGNVIVKKAMPLETLCPT